MKFNCHSASLISFLAKSLSESLVVFSNVRSLRRKNCGKGKVETLQIAKGKERGYKMAIAPPLVRIRVK